MFKSTHSSRDLFILFACILAASSCDYKSSSYRKLESERDSLLTVVSEKDSVSNAMNEYLDVISSSLDSIKAAETIYTLDVDQDGHKLKKAQIKDNLSLLEDVIHRQRSRIEELESQVQKSENAAKKYKTLIANLYAQIDEKDAKIRQMQTDLAKRDKTIQELNTQVSAIRTDLANAEQKNLEQQQMLESQSSILSMQDKIANTAYIITGTRRELLDKGILKGLSSKIQSGSLSSGISLEVDMREFTDMSFSSKHPKVLSSMPKDSYTITKTSDGSVLTVTDPGRFWSVTTYLVIQL